MAKKGSVERFTEASVSDDDFASSSEEDEKVVFQKTKKLNSKDIESEDDFDDEDEEVNPSQFLIKKTAATRDIKDMEEEDEDDVEAIEEEEEVAGDDDEIVEDTSHLESFEKSKVSKKLGKLKNLTPEQLLKEQKRIKKTGVCYLSRIPPFMKPAKLRSILSRFGEIDRLFLKPEDTNVYQKRVKYGGNKKKNFTEGWVEFINKKDAKLCEASLNGQIVGGKKTSYYYDDVMNIKYLSGFKWMDLTQQIAKENEIRQSKLSMEISQQQKLNKNFVSNVEKSKMITNIQRKRKERQGETEGESVKEDKDIEIRRNFKQRKTASTRADADEKLKERSKPNEKLNNVLSRVF